MLGFCAVSECAISSLPDIIAAHGAAGEDGISQSQPPFTDGLSAFLDTADRADQRRRRLADARRELGLTPEPEPLQEAAVVSRETLPLPPSRIALLAAPVFPANAPAPSITREMVAELAASAERSARKAREALRMAEIADEEEVLMLLAALV